MYVNKVCYEIRKRLGEYEHENLSVEVVQDALEQTTGDEMMKEAKRICLGSISRVDPPRPVRPGVSSSSKKTYNGRTALNQGTNPNASGYRSQNPKKDYAPTDWSQYPYSATLNGIKNDDAFGAAKDFLKSQAWVWNKERKLWQGKSCPDFSGPNASFAWLEERINLEDGQGDDDVQTTGWESA